MGYHRKKNTYHKQEKLSALLLLTELPNFLILPVCGFLSQSLLVWMDVIDSFNSVMHALLVMLLSRKLKKDLRYEYNYGIGKVEGIASVFCDAGILFSVVGVGFFAVVDLISPRDQSTNLLAAIGLKFFHVALDVYFLKKQLEVSQSPLSRIDKAEIATHTKDLLFDVVLLVSLSATVLFASQPWTWYLSPLVSLLLCVFLALHALQRLKSSIAELTDKTLSEENQLQILNALAALDADYSDLKAVNSRRCGHTVYIDLQLVFREDTPYSEIIEFQKKITARLKDAIPGCDVQIILK